MEYSQPKKSSVGINGINLSFQISGRGFPLVLIHTDHTYAKYFLSSLSASQNFQVITIDIPGYYSTGQKKAVDTLDKFIDLLDKLFDQLKFKKVDLLGECLGSVIVLKYAAKYPQRVRKLIVVSLPLRVFDRPIKKSFHPMVAFFKNYKIAGSLAKFIIRLNLWRQITDFFGGYQGFWDLFNREAALVSKFNFDQRVFWGVLTDLFETDIKKILQNLKSETLFVAGEKDKVTKKKEIMKLCQQHPNTSCAFIPKANHALVSKNTRQFNQLVTKFLLK